MNKTFALISLLSGFLMTAQVGIGTATPDPAAVLDVNSEISTGAYGGLKLPTINEADKSSIATPIPDGLMLYVIDGLERCVEIYDANTSTWVLFYCMNLVPVATNVNILDDGTPQITETLTTDFDQLSASFQTDNENDAPGTPVYQWYRADDAAGLNEIAIADPEGIAATYTLVAADNDKFIRLGIRPTAIAGASPGLEVFSTYTSQVEYLPTIIEFDPQLATLAENASPDDIDLVFEFPNVSTTAVMVTVASDDYTRLDETGPVTITIPANQTSPFTTTVFNIEDNALTDGTASLIFTITAVTGGLGPNSIGVDDQDLLDITDDETIISTYVQDFDGTNTWTYSLSTPLCNSSGDVWDIVSSLGGITMTNNFFGIQDLDGNCGSSAGETISFNTVNISTQTQVSFDYDVFEFDTGDDVEYTVYFDGVGSTTVLVNGNDNLSVSGTETISIPLGTTTVSLELFVDQNGAGDRAGFDNFIIQ